MRGLKGGQLGDEHEEERLGSAAGKWLALDTSTSAMTIAVINGETVLGESNIHAVRNHSTLLLPAIGQLMSSLHLKMADLQGIAAGQGPGSYTGVRIGVTVAKTFAWALNLPLAGVSSMEALAFQGRELHRSDSSSYGLAGALGRYPRAWIEWIVPIVDARRNQVFTGLYAASGKKWNCLTADSICVMNEWLDKLVELTASNDNRVERPERIIFVGEVAPFEGWIEKFAMRIPMKIESRTMEIRARDIGQLGLGLWGRGELQEVHSFAPNYAQMTEAEKNLLSLKQS